MLYTHCPPPSNQPAILLRLINRHLPQQTRYLRRRAAITRRHVQGRVLEEEISRPQQQSERFGRHDGVVFGRWEVRDPECVPQYDVGVLDALVGRGFDPFGKTARGVAGGLGHVPAGGVELVVAVWGREGS